MPSWGRHYRWINVHQPLLKDIAMRYKKTELGQTVLQNRAFALTPRQRSAFIMFNGHRSVEEVIQATAGLGVTADDINVLVRIGLLAPITEPAAPAAPSFALPATATTTASAAVPMPGQTFVADSVPSQPDQAHYSKAYPIATRLTAGLGLRGFRLNLAVEAAGNLHKLQQLAPKIKDAVGPEKFRALEQALYE